MTEDSRHGRPLAAEGATINIRGAFTPLQFSPAWFRDLDLIGAQEFRDADIEGITPDISSMSLGWLHCTVSADNLVLSTTSVDDLPLLRDVGIGVLKNLHTPLSALGINREYHVTMKEWSEIHRIGDTLAPKSLWEEIMPSPGTKDLTIWGGRTDDFGGRLHVTVQPSTRFKKSVYILVNDHYNLTKVDDQPDMREEGSVIVEDVKVELSKHPVALEVLASKWDDSLDQAEDIRRRIIRVGIES